MANTDTSDGTEVSALEQRIHDGYAFEMAHLFSIPNAGGEGELRFRTGAKKVVVHERRVTPNGDEITYQAFREPTVSADGTPVSVGKRNGRSSILPEVTVFHTPTVSANGEGIPPLYLPGEAGHGHVSSGQFAEEAQVRILESNTTYLIKVTNNGTKNPVTVEVYLLWAEIAPND